jgi:hypothetical protein
MKLTESLRSTVMPDNVVVPGPVAANSSQPPLPAKVVSLHVRPFFASHLCFETDGILENLNLILNPKAVGLLGAPIPGFDFDLFYGILGSRPTLRANGSITFTKNPAAGSTIVLNGATWTFASSLTIGNQLLIGPNLDATLDSAVKTLQASADANTKNFIYAMSGSVLVARRGPPTLLLTAATGGSGGNALTISTTVLGATASGSTLSGGDSSRLLYDFLKIQADVAPFTLATLRAEPKKAALEKAINMRQNAYFAKYANQDSIISFANRYYFNPPDFGLNGPPNKFSKSYRLDDLSDTNEHRWAALNGAYASAGRQDGSPGVVDEIISTLSADTTGYGYAASSQTDETTTIAKDPNAQVWILPDDLLPQRPPGPTGQPQWPPVKPAANAPLPVEAWSDAWYNDLGPNLTGTTYSYDLTSSYETNSNSDTAHQDQVVKTSSQTFRHPFYDAKAQYQRAPISLIDQQFSALQSAQNIPNLATVLGNELASIDADVYRLQIAYLNTILMSPIAGVVTGVYKNPGDPVRAGEPVIRVEYFDVIQIEAIVVFRGPVLVNQTSVTITTALFGSSAGQPTSISGLVVAARIHNDDDTWHLIVECANKDGSTPPKPIFPPGYRFDPDDTTATIG